MNNQLVSVIMPAYNAQDCIHMAIESVLEQTYVNIELIIINDGSTDNTKRVIQSFNDERIVYIEQENAGQCRASNTGLTNAKGDFIKFLDADDVINREHIQIQIEKIANHENAICSCEWGRFYNDDPATAKFFEEPMWKNMSPIDWLKLALQQESGMMAGWLWLIPKKILKKTGGWDERLSLNNDFEFTTRLLLGCEKVLFASGAKLFYRTGRHSLSVSKSVSAYEAAYLSTKSGCIQLLQKENSLLMRSLCANRYRDWIYQFYPRYHDLYAVIENEISILGGSNLKPGGGRTFRMLSSLFGWKIAKKLQFMIQKNSS